MFINTTQPTGTLAARYKDIVIPPSVPRIFLSNFRCFRNPDEAVYDRRCKVMDLTPRAPSPDSVIDLVGAEAPWGPFQ